MLAITDLSKSYGENSVLREVSFSMTTGERVALMGPSGSGKSTLLNCISGIDRPNSGSIELNGQSIGGMDERQLCELRRDSISTIFQFFHLLPTLTMRENIEFPMQLIRLAEKERKKRVDELIHEVQLDHRADAMPDELSGGERQRVAIARALATRPVLILADEPTGNLDTTTGESILDLLETVSGRYQTAMLLVTHSKRVTRICQRTVSMKDGRIVDDEK
ncbi:MAG: ABC transporter ATP-binding protein [Verrucomicrobiales bacterium]|nr:ABC transporter ATP-binding protein [Verrucomicrobiales bacterium]